MEPNSRSAIESASEKYAVCPMTVTGLPLIQVIELPRLKGHYRAMI